MALQDEIDEARSEIRTDDYAMSIGEWMSLYERLEIDIHPEFQRFFRWDNWQKTRLIESLLLGIPIPPVFVAERDDGVWDVVDGLQRLSTIFQFAGVLRDENGGTVSPFRLEATDYLPSLGGKVWEDEQNPETALTATQRLIIKRAKIHVSIIQRKSQDRAKYDLFDRLNTGGSSLSSQELRNCILVSLNRDMYEWLRQLSRNENFTSCINLTDRAILEQYDLELVLRFLVFRRLPEETLRAVGDLDNFLTKKMRDMALSPDYDREEESEAFNTTFEILANTTRGDSFRRYDATRGKFVGGFLVSAFEAVGLGVGYNCDQLATHSSTSIEDKVMKLWQMPEFTTSAGSGIRASTRIPKVITLGRRLFRP